MIKISQIRNNRKKNKTHTNPPTIEIRVRLCKYKFKVSYLFQ